MDDKNQRLKQLAQEILSILGEEEQAPMEQEEQPADESKELKKAALVAKLKKHSIDQE